MDPSNQLPNRPPIPDNVHPDQSTLQADESYFNWARQTGQPWPERPRVLDFTRTKKGKHVILPELNVPIQEVYYGRDGTLRFSRTLSRLISLKLSDSKDNLKKPKEAKGLPHLAQRAKSKWRRFMSHREPTTDPIQLPFNNIRVNSISNIQFPECILEPDDFMWLDERIRITASAAERMLENVILWIDEKHWVLNSFKHLSCAPKEKLFRDRRDSYKGINILLNHITNGRWIYISSVKPVLQTKYMLGPKKLSPSREKPKLRVDINIQATKNLHDTRMAFFSFRTSDPKAALTQFCERRTIHMISIWDLLEPLNLYIYLSNPHNSFILEYVSKKLPAQMEKYWNIKGKDSSELEALIRRNSAPEPHRLTSLFKRPPARRIRTDPEEIRMATRRLSIERENPSCKLEACDPRFCTSVAAILSARARKIEIRRIVRKAILAYSREKRRHEKSCHPCFWDDPKTCKVHSDKAFNSKKRAEFCLRCWMLFTLAEYQKRGIPYQVLAMKKEKILSWDQEHQSKDAPEYWCCHAKEPCNKVCFKEHRTSCRGDCEVTRMVLGAGTKTVKKEETVIFGYLSKVQPCLRMKIVPIEKPSPPEIPPVEEESAPKIEEGSASPSHSSPKSSQDESVPQASTEEKVAEKGFWKALHRWRTSKLARRLQTKLQMRPVSVR